jgi:hypothetical protein
MLSKSPGGRTALRSRLVLALIGVAAVGFGIWGFTPRVVGEHVTDCGFDAHGAYAKVRVNNLPSGAREQALYVALYVEQYPYVIPTLR